MAVKPRLTLTKFEGETKARSAGYLAVLDGTRSEGNTRPVAARFTLALGPATQERRGVAVGDLLRGDAFPVPPEAASTDTPSDLYRIGALRTIARAGEPGARAALPPDPPRTDPPLNTTSAEAAPRRLLHPDHLTDDTLCALCPYGIMVPVVRLTDPRDYRTGTWKQLPACLGPTDCPYYAAP